MHSRYRKNTAITRDGNTYYAIPERTTFAVKGSDLYYDVLPEDTLHRIAFKILGDQKLWWVVAYFNDVVDPFATLEPGTTVRLPNPARLWLEVLE